jgi:hypothetical protein
MRQLTSVLGSFALATLMVASAGCASPTDDETESDQGALRTGPTEEVATFAPSVRLLDSYNALLDRTTGTKCVTGTDVQPTVGDTREEFFLRQVTSRSELAKELNVDVTASFKVPSVEVNASVKVVRSFKESSNKVVFVIRAASSYKVANAASVDLSPVGQKLFGAGKAGPILQKCGGSYVNAVTYQADVAAILEFEATSSQDARAVEASLGVSTSLFDAKVNASVKNAVQKLAQTNTLTVRIVSSGFRSGAASTGEALEQGDAVRAIANLDSLRGEMSRSLQDDMKRDRDGYFKNNSRDARAVLVSQATYASLESAPGPEAFGPAAATLRAADTFHTSMTTLETKLSAASAEFDAFLAAKTPARYNTPGNPQFLTASLLNSARTYKASYAAGAEMARSIAERCLEQAAHGDYTGCTDSPGVTIFRANAAKSLGAYEAVRIAELSAVIPTTAGRATKVTFAGANEACGKLGMRLAKATEMRAVAPMVAGIEAPNAVWYAADTRCKHPYFVWDGVATSNAIYGGCAADAMDGPLPFLCVPAGGPFARR